MNRRRLANDPTPSPLRKETRMVKGIHQFRNIHIALRPAGAAVAPAPTAPVDLLVQGPTFATTSDMSNPMRKVPASAPPSGTYSNDLLSLSVGAAPPPPVVASNTVGAGAGGHQLPVSAPPSSNYFDDLLALGFDSSPSPQVTDSTALSGELKKNDPFSMQVMAHATPTAELPTANNNHLPQLTLPQQPTFQQAPTSSSFVMTSDASVYASSQPAFQMNLQPQAMLKSSNTTQLNQTRSQPNPMSNASFSAAMQQQQPQASAKGPMMNQLPISPHPAQGGNFPGNYHHQPPQQQHTVNNAANSFAPSGFQPNRSMPLQMSSYGVGHSTQGNPSGAPPPRQPMIQGASQTQQGVFQVPVRHQNAHASAQNK